jgi:YYY domain-containing protein
MFNRQGLQNRYPGLAALAWWVTITVMGWIAFPLVFTALPQLADRGYGLARVLGLLLLAYLTWVVASLRLLPNTRATIVGVLGIVTLAGLAVGWRSRAQLRQFVRARLSLLVAMETVFATLYWLWVGVRLLNPDLWHPIVGGEKPMDFAYLNAVMKSTWFPPYNPWLSGTFINYYYFGFVIVGTLIKLLGTVPAIAYNLAVPLLFALTGLGGFSVALNLFGRFRRGAILAAFLAVVFIVLIGNLGVVRLIRVAAIRLGGDLIPSTIPGLANTVAMVRGLWEIVAHGAQLPIRIESWYWYPTRIIPASPGEAGPITEFPAFTFLYADLHAHMIALPLTLFALSLAIYWATQVGPHWGSLLLGGLVIGALWPTNTWDYPTYLAIGLAAMLLGVWRRWHRATGLALLKSQARAAGALILLSVIMYLPYSLQYAAGYSSVRIWEGSRTPADIYLWMHGIFLFPIGTRMAIEAVRVLDRAGWRRMRLTVLMGAILVVVSAGTLAYFGLHVAAVAVPLLCLAAFLGLAPGVAASRRLMWWLVALAVVLTLIVEIVVLKGDIGRMNTVFKFYLQVWTLLSVTAAVAIAWLRQRMQHWQSRWPWIWGAVLALLIAGGAIFLPLGIRSRAIDRMAPEAGLTLDGMAYIDHAEFVAGDPAANEQQEISLSGDYAAIRWIQDHVEGSPVIIEGLGYREYLWANRISIYTGLPTVVGWEWHQVQQRAALSDGMVGWRRNDVRTFYQTADIDYAMEVLRRYGVRYVYVGPYERVYYSGPGLDKLEDMADSDQLRIVYDAEGVQIYEVTDGLAS